MLHVAKTVVVNVWDDINNNHTLAMAASLSYYFVLSLFPLLMLAGAVLSLLPVPHLFDSILNAMARVVPPDAMGMVRRVVADVVKPHSTALLSFGIVGTIWTASSGFANMIEALDVAYDVPETRPWYETRALAIGLTFVVGFIMVVALGVMVLGPQFGTWLVRHFGIDEFGEMWPVIRWFLAIGFTVLAVELLYLWAPNVRQSCRQTLIGAAIAVGGWIGLSFGLGIYLRSIANLNKTYGTLGGAMALSVWFYWSAIAILVGAEINSEILQARGDGRLPLKRPPPPSVKPRKATEAEHAA